MAGRARQAAVKTPDGRYIVVRGRLWRAANPGLGSRKRQALVKRLMQARRKVGAAMRAKDSSQLRAARQQVQACKAALGERGPVWWNDGAPDYNRRLAGNTPYAHWYAGLHG